MRTLLLALALTVSSLGCSKSETAASARRESQVGTVTIDELDRMIAGGNCSPVDANGQATRTKMGVIPGAVLISDSNTYKPSELPADESRALVFYCANPKCGASHDAARRAITAGYSNVKVLPDGIAGWVKAGKRAVPYVVQTGS